MAGVPLVVLHITVYSRQPRSLPGLRSLLDQQPNDFETVSEYQDMLRQMPSYGFHVQAEPWAFSVNFSSSFAAASEFPIGLAVRNFLYWHVPSPKVGGKPPPCLSLVESNDSRLLCSFCDWGGPFVVLLDDKYHGKERMHQIQRGLEMKSRLRLKCLQHIWASYTNFERDTVTTTLSLPYLEDPSLKSSKVTALQLAIRQEQSTNQRFGLQVTLDPYKFLVQRCILKDPSNPANEALQERDMTIKEQYGVFAEDDIVADEKLCYATGFWWSSELPTKGVRWGKHCLANPNKDYNLYPLTLKGVSETAGATFVLNRTSPVSKINCELNVEVYDDDLKNEATQLRVVLVAKTDIKVFCTINVTIFI